MDISDQQETPTKKEIAREYLRHAWLFVKDGLKFLRQMFVNFIIFR